MSLGYSLPNDETAAAFYREFVWNLPDHYNIASVVLDERAPTDAIALQHIDGAGERHTFTYADLSRAVDAIAAGLDDAGVNAGDRVAVCLPTSPELLVAHLGVLRLGAVVVPLSMLLGDEVVDSVFHRTAPTAVIADAERTDDCEALLDAVPFAIRVEPGHYETNGAVGGLSDLTRSSAEVDSVTTEPGDPGFVLFTSGTSGKPKGVVAPHSYLAGSLPGYHCWFHLFSLDDAAATRVWSPSEWAWAGALFNVVYPTLALGGTVVSRLRRCGFDPHIALDFLTTEGITHAFFPPTAVARFRSTTQPDPSNLALEAVTCGGESLAPALRRWAENAFDAPVNEAYGQTEANAMVGNCQAAFKPKEGSIGKPYPGHKVFVVNDEGNSIPPETRGEVVLSLPDPVAFQGYWENEEATAAVRREGRLHTGDLARRDADGYLIHAGRVDDLIVTSGYRVDPLEVERVLVDHPRVVEAIVAGVDDPERGERVAAVVTLESDTNMVENEDTLREEMVSLVRKRLGAYKVPREIRFVDSIPESRTGKAKRDGLF